MKPTAETHGSALPGFTRIIPTPTSFPDYQPPNAEPILYGLIGTWHEADIIEATVKNCFANGCSRVYILDNASPDATCVTAEEAGATIAEVYVTNYYCDDTRVRKMNNIAYRITTQEKLANLWWLTIDADEFPCAPGGAKLIDYLATLDNRYGCLGCPAIDLYPTEPGDYTTGMHPADCMPSGILRTERVFCTRNHWKHPLLRYIEGNVALCQSRGLHVPYVQSPIKLRRKKHVPPIEPTDDIVMFHAPIRRKEDTFRRLRTLCSPKSALEGRNRGSLDDKVIGNNGSIKRWRTLEHVYNKEWSKVELPHSQRFGRDITGIALYPWRKLLPGLSSFPRWYPDPNIQTGDRKISLGLV